MTKFKAGDKVRRTGPSVIHEGVHNGQEYVVSEFHGAFGIRLKGVRYEAYWYSVESFELVEDGSTEDLVNHPSHYTSDPSGVECIQITRHRNFNIGNAFKYLWRNGLKDSAAKSAREKQVEDLRKAIFYIEDEIKRIEGQE